MQYTFRVSPRRYNYLHILGKPLWQPKSYISLFISLLINESIHSLNNYHHLLIDLLGTVDDLLLLHLSTYYVQPIWEEFSNVLLKKIYVLLQPQGLLQSDDYLVQRVEVVAIVATPACEV